MTMRILFLGTTHVQQQYKYFSTILLKATKVGEHLFYFVYRSLALFHSTKRFFKVFNFLYFFKYLKRIFNCLSRFSLIQ